VETTAPATGLMLTDTIQFAGAFTVTVDPQLNCDPMSGMAVSPTQQNIICTSPSGGAINDTMQLTLTTVPMSSGWMTNTVEVSSFEQDDDPTNNRDSIILYVKEEEKAPIPTIRGWGIAMLIMLVGLLSVIFLRRKRDVT
ncbi:MAG: hypothetical protein JRJ60_19485, partial [Deltaproteobacteria bacterium]|nr:hypothetical protein [Deltaproteobacteria bacterium]